MQPLTSQRESLAPSLVRDPAADVTLQAPPTMSTDALDRSLVRGIAWLGGVKWLVQLITWGSTIIVARILTPEDYGLMSMAAVLILFITMLSESGIGATVVTIPDLTAEQIAQLNGGAVLLGFASFAVACAAAAPIAWFYETPAVAGIIVAASSALIITAFRIVPGALMQRQLRFPRLAAIDGAQALLQAGATIALAFLGFRYWSLVLGGVLGALLGTVATMMAQPSRMRVPRYEVLRPVLPFTRDVLLTRLFWYVSTNSDFIVAGKRLGSQALGAYSYAWTLASMPVDRITALVGGVTPPLFATVQQNVAMLRRYFLTITEGLAAIAFPLTIGISLVAEDLVPFLFGDRWRFMTIPLQLLAAYASVRTITPTASQVLVVTGDTRYQMRIMATASVLFPLGFLIGSRWGTLGIALAWMVVHPLIVYLPLQTRVNMRLGISLSDYLRALAPALSGCAAMALAVLGIERVLPSTAPIGWRLAAQIGVGAVVYCGSIFALHRDRLTMFLRLIQSRT